MISDTLFQAIEDIEYYERERPGTYGDWADDIDVVKSVMSSLLERLDQPPGEYPLDIAETLTPDKQERWRVTCEANIARWADRLRLLGPVSADELVGKLDDAIKRQDAMLKERSNTDDAEERGGVTSEA